MSEIKVTNIKSAKIEKLFTVLPRNLTPEVHYNGRKNTDT